MTYAIATKSKAIWKNSGLRHVFLFTFVFLLTGFTTIDAHTVKASEPGTKKSRLSVCEVPPAGNTASSTPATFITLTPTGVLLNQYLNGYSTEDMWMEPDNTYINVREERYFSRLSMLSPTAFLYPGGSPSHYVIYSPGDTDPYESTGNGYNCNLCQNDTLCSEEHSSPCKVGYGYCCMDWPISFYPYTIELAKDFCAKIIPVYNAERNNYSEFKWAIEYAQAATGVDYVLLGQENNLPLYNNSISFPEGGKSYKNNVINPVSDSIHMHFPGLKVAIDGAPPESKKDTDKEWNKQIKKDPNKCDSISRLYLMDSHYFTLPEGGTYQSYLDTVNKAITTGFPKRMNKFHTTFPGYYAALTEWGVSGGDDKLPYANTTLSALYVAKFGKAMIEYDVDNANFIRFATYYRLSSLGLDKKDMKTQYYALYQYAKLFKPNALVWRVASTQPGIEGIATEDISGYHLMLINDTSTSVSFEALKIDDGTAEGIIITSFTGEAVYGSGLKTTAIKKEPLNYTIPGYSIVVIEFKKENMM